MKRIIVALLLISILSACSSPYAAPAITETNESDQPQINEAVWPVNTYTDGLPVPTGTVSWVRLDTEQENCSISLVDMSETDYNDYMELLKQEGFSVVDGVSEEIKGQDYVFVGTLLSNGEKGLSVSYIANTFTIYISFLP